MQRAGCGGAPKVQLWGAGRSSACREENLGFICHFFGTVIETAGLEREGLVIQ